MIQLIDDQRDAWAVAEDVAGFIGTSQFFYVDGAASDASCWPLPFIKSSKLPFDSCLLR